MPAITDPELGAIADHPAPNVMPATCEPTRRFTPMIVKRTVATSSRICPDSCAVRRRHAGAGEDHCHIMPLFSSEAGHRARHDPARLEISSQGTASSPRTTAAGKSQCGSFAQLTSSSS